jgi:hypothetical protein
VRLEAGVEVSGGFIPESGVGIGDGDSLPFLNGLGELEVEMIGDAEVALAVGGVERATFEADTLNGDCGVVGLDGKFCGRRKDVLEIGGDEIPLGGAGRRRSFGGDESEFKEIGSEDAEVRFADGRERERRIDGGRFVGEGNNRQSKKS